jgi:hypothetical protein
MAVKKKSVGRPRKGRDGDKVSEYAPLTIRLPPDVRNTLKAVAFVRSEPVSAIVEQSLAVFLKTLTRGDRALVKTITKRHEK